MPINLDQVLGILNSGDVPRVCTEEEFVIVYEALLRHPRANEKIGCGVKQIHIKHGLYGSRSFYAERVDGSFTDFSVYKCFRKSMSTSGAKFRQAARWAAELPVITGLDLHHEPPWSFEEIVKEFTKKIDLDKIQYDHSKLGIQFADQGLATTFRQFHDDRAVLRYLTTQDHHNTHMNLVRSSKKYKTFDLYNPMKGNYDYSIGWHQVDTIEKFQMMQQHLSEKNWITSMLLEELEYKAKKLWNK